MSRVKRSGRALRLVGAIGSGEMTGDSGGGGVRLSLSVSENVKSLSSWSSSPSPSSLDLRIPYLVLGGICRDARPLLKPRPRPLIGVEPREEEEEDPVKLLPREEEPSRSRRRGGRTISARVGLGRSAGERGERVDWVRVTRGGGRIGRGMIVSRRRQADELRENEVGPGIWEASAGKGMV